MNSYQKFQGLFCLKIPHFPEKFKKPEILPQSNFLRKFIEKSKIFCLGMGSLFNQWPKFSSYILILQKLSNASVNIGFGVLSRNLLHNLCKIQPKLRALKEILLFRTLKLSNIHETFVRVWVKNVHIFENNYEKFANF